VSRSTLRAPPETKKTASYAGFFGCGKASEERGEGVYVGYMTEQIDAAGAARNEKDK
jgi:hypothetical protein